MSTQEPAQIRPRTMSFPFSDGIPRHWLAGLPVATHLANGVNLLFPAGERFFIRSVRHYLDRIDDAALRAQIQGFFGQEGRHANAHERAFEALEAQGYHVRRFLQIYERIGYGLIEPPAPPALRLAVTVALEHYTAILAEHALESDLLDHAHPVMRDLLRWHAAEEIEHKAVAFDVLRQVAPGYPLRMAGLAVATACLGSFWIAAAAMLLWQDGRRGRLRRGGGPKWDPERLREVFMRVFVRGLRDYMRRDFHPSQKDDMHLARGYLESIGAL